MPKRKALPDARLDGVKIIFRNLSGIERKFNAEGKRNFSIVLSPEQAGPMKADGWNVKVREPKDEEGDTLLHIKANVNYKGRPPAIWLVTSRGRSLLDEATVGMLDYADITNVDVILHPYFFDEDTVVAAAYVKTMFVTINEDELEAKYAELDDKGGNEVEPSPPWED